MKNRFHVVCEEQLTRRIQQPLISLTIKIDEVRDMFAAYIHFKDMPKIRVVNVTSKLDTLRFVEIIFVYDETFIGQI